MIGLRTAFQVQSERRLIDSLKKITWKPFSYLQVTSAENQTLSSEEKLEKTNEFPDASQSDFRLPSIKFPFELRYIPMWVFSRENLKVELF